ncbi:THAP domain-containing protein 5 [Rhinoderma darwinii]|uniref:THAP domain-containing protein 5 n=1 Tax=Rhinoderma darwinii TaxID=43563 RepID=UPI003F6616CB
MPPWKTIINTSSGLVMSFEVPLREQGDIVSENLHRFHVDIFSHKPQTSDKSLVFTAINKTIEQLGSTEGSIITIIGPEDPHITGSSITEEENLDVEHIFSNESDRADKILEMEHSYCRYDDRNRLWETIARLQSKIAELEVQESITLARLRSLETLIGQLKQENVLSEEKLKIIDNCQNNFDFAVVQ